MSSKPLSRNQQELVNVVKATHLNLLAARRLKQKERELRFVEAQARMERDLEEMKLRIAVEIDAEIAAHESAQDEAIIAAFNAGVPIRRIALDGFGNRYDGAVHQALRELRRDGRVGYAVDFQRNTSGELEVSHEVEFPQPIDVEGILSEATAIEPPRFELLRDINGSLLTLVEPDADGENGIYAHAVILTLDARDPWYRQIEANARPGTPYRYSQTATLYIHPGTGELTVHESREEGDILWDHPVARWVKVHPEEARRGFDEALGA